MRRQWWLYGRRPNGLVKSYQRSNIVINSAASADATLSPSVDMNNAYVLYLGHTTDDAGTTMPVTTVRIQLIDTKTVRATNGLASGSQIANYEVVEFWPGVIKSVQRGSIVVGGSTSAIVNINPVDITRTSLLFLGYTSNATVNNQHHVRLTLTDSTTVTVTVGASGSSSTVEYEVVEWY